MQCSYTLGFELNLWPDKSAKNLGRLGLRMTITSSILIAFGKINKAW